MNYPKDWLALGLAALAGVYASNRFNRSTAEIVAKQPDYEKYRGDSHPADDLAAVVVGLSAAGGVWLVVKAFRCLTGLMP